MIWSYFTRQTENLIRVSCFNLFRHCVQQKVFGPGWPGLNFMKKSFKNKSQSLVNHFMSEPGQKRGNERQREPESRSLG